MTTDPSLSTMITIRRMATTDISRMGEIDRSEHVTRAGHLGGLDRV
jgi:hypothetical protein